MQLTNVTITVEGVNLATYAHPIGTTFWIMGDNRPIMYTVESVELSITAEGIKEAYLARGRTTFRLTKAELDSKHRTKQELLDSF